MACECRILRSWTEQRCSKALETRGSKAGQSAYAMGGFPDLDKKGPRRPDSDSPDFRQRDEARRYAQGFQANLPRLKKEEVKVEVEDGKFLQISGERSREHEEKTNKWHRWKRQVREAVQVA
ncbi:22.0 kDa heat shock protein-like [Telopea speciosissima]|uniref:22.0 kDa heat shock protein-like n=1 Tax=Telopea speciosissima TaxID=54955 RepID=UPI001CC63DF4|nr:22.0 kDa heat shock protein-like [Telopea speciosissima]